MEAEVIYSTMIGDKVVKIDEVLKGNIQRELHKTGCREPLNEKNIRSVKELFIDDENSGKIVDYSGLECCPNLRNLEIIGQKNFDYAILNRLRKLKVFHTDESNMDIIKFIYGQRNLEVVSTGMNYKRDFLHRKDNFTKSPYLYLVEDFRKSMKLNGLQLKRVENIIWSPSIESIVEALKSSMKCYSVARAYCNDLNLDDDWLDEQIVNILNNNNLSKWYLKTFLDILGDKGLVLTSEVSNTAVKRKILELQLD